MNAEKISTN